MSSVLNPLREAKRRWYQRNREKEIARTTAWRKANLERAREYGRRAAAKDQCTRRGRVGVNRPTYDQMLARQSNTCATCDTQHSAEKPLHVDHDHATGAVRGLLCRGCNIRVGHLRDDPARLRAAADYLERHAKLQSLL